MGQGKSKVMPKIGETRYGLGTLSKNKHSYHWIWWSCSTCGFERWVRFDPKKNKVDSERCRHCQPSGINSLSWKGGRMRTKEGYIRVHLYPNDPYYPIAPLGGWIAEHRLVMAKKLGRYLLKSEIPHHINGIKDDNRPENLEILSPNLHSVRTQICNHCELKKEIRLLRWQVKELIGKSQGKLI